MKFSKTYLLLLTLPFLFGALEAEDKKNYKKQSFQDKQIMERLKLDIAEIKGPPSLDDVKQKQAQAADDLLLVINSGRYEGKRLERLKILHERMLQRPDPTQLEINKAHNLMIEKMRNANNQRLNKSAKNINMQNSRNQMQEMREIMHKNPSRK